jgi:hypothetical protein
MNQLYNDPIGQKARGGQAPPTEPPPASAPGIAPINGGCGPAPGVPAKSQISWGEAQPGHAAGNW